MAGSSAGMQGLHAVGENWPIKNKLTCFFFGPFVTVSVNKNR
jgi:hypothetical protein